MPLNIKKICMILIFCANSLHKVNYSLAQSHFQTYNAKVFNLGIDLTYKYIVINVGKRKK